MTQYPTYYRKAGRVIKRLTDTTGVEVQIPEPNKLLPTIHSPVTYPDKQRMDEAVQAMEPCTNEVYESYLFTLCQITELKRQELTRVRENRKLPPPPVHAVS